MRLLFLVALILVVPFKSYSKMFDAKEFDLENG